MKPVMVALYGVGFCGAVAFGAWLGTDQPADEAVTAAQPPASLSAEGTASANQAGDLWAWGNPGAAKADVNKANAAKANKSLDLLVAQALRATNVSGDGNDPRDRLRKLVQEDSAVMKQLMQSYDKENNSQTRDLIVSMLSGVDKPEVLAFSRRLATSKDMAQRKDGFTMLQTLSSDSAEVRPIILQVLSGDRKPEEIMLALAALRPPSGAENNPSQSSLQAADAAAVVAQLKALTSNADPNIRLQSILQLALWDRADSSQEQWSQALADQSPQVRQAAVTAIAQSGTQSGAVKTALLGLASNPNEIKDVRGSALQVLERFTLSQDEAVNFSQLRSQILGS